MEEEIEKYLKTHNINKDMLDRFDLYFPKILVPTIPLSFTGITPRNFYSWKENGLIELSLEKEGNERKKVKFNLIEFIWVKMIQTMRGFGLSYELIRQLKFALFSDSISQLKYSWFEIEGLCKTMLNYDDEQIEVVKNLFDKTVENFDKLLENGDLLEIERTYIYLVIAGTIMNDVKASVLILKTDIGFKIDVTTHDKLEEVRILSQESLLKPHFQIPINGIIEDFFNEPKSEKFAESFGFLNTQEKKILDALRKKDFLELVIKLDYEKEYIIDLTTHGEITDEQANKVRKILGLSKYEEVNVKYRNDKNLYYKNKKRL